MVQPKAPGVYVVEKSALPNSVVDVATAVPAFIGHTERADNQGKPLGGVPFRISSMAEYHPYFGARPMPLFDIAHDPGGRAYQLTQLPGRAGGRYLLYLGLLHFFQNGGGPCYIVSVGDYTAEVDAGALQKGIDALATEQEPTMVLVPDAVLLDQPGCMAVQRAMLAHCGEGMRNRMAILDIWGGWQGDKDTHCVTDFRNTLGSAHRDVGAAYFPWLNTTVVQETDLGLDNFLPACRRMLIDLLKHDVGVDTPLPATAKPADHQRWQAMRQTIDDIDKDFTAPTAGGPPPDAEAEAVAQDKARLDKTLSDISVLFKTLRADMAAQLNLLPPGAAMAGVWTMVDNTRGVWKAPANVSLNSVLSPAVALNDAAQEDLNTDPQGLYINAIRPFVGKGVLVWGARTLDGNSADWRYISVRRTVMMIEESCRLAAQAMVFEPNVANTWVTVKSMLQTFLTGIWQRGGLAGAVAKEAFAVQVGLGETMTPQDVLDGVLRVTVLVAITRPGEFIAIKFAQQMQAA